jgi:hypothetical protein
MAAVILFFYTKFEVKSGSVADVRIATLAVICAIALYLCHRS